MKCPYRKTITHYPAKKFNDRIVQAAFDEEAFGECYNAECPYYDVFESIMTGEKHETCLKTINEGREAMKS